MLLAVAAAFALMLGASAPAFGSQTHFHQGSFGEQVFEPRGVAVDQSSGSRYVADLRSKEVRKFDSTGDPASFSALGTNSLGKFGFEDSSTGEPSPLQIAVDGSGGSRDGDVYVTGGLGGGIRAFKPSGEPADFSASAPYISGNTLTGTPGGSYWETCGVAVDSNGAIYVGDSFPGTIDIYAPSGEYLTQVPGDLPCNLAVDSGGNVYVNRKVGGILRYAPDSYPVTAATTYGAPTAVTSTFSYGVAVDPADDNLYVNHRTYVAQYDSAANGNALLGRFGLEEMAVDGSTGIAVDRSGGATDGDVLVPSGARFGPAGERVDVFGPAVTVADVVTGEATGVSGSAATLDGTVSADNGPAASCEFAYVADAAFQASGYAEARSAPCDPAGPFSGATVEAVSAHPSDLSPETTYHFRLEATNADGVAKGESVEFTTPQAVKEVITGEATDLTTATATLNGTVNPAGHELSECRFEYGPTSAYGQSAPCAESGAEIGSADEAVAVHAEVSGLSSGIHHFRLVAGNAEGTTRGQDQSFAIDGAPTVLSQSVQPFFFEATLKATIVPNGRETSYRFEYGPSTSYGHLTPPVSVPAATAPVQVQAQVLGLAEGSGYHFRIIASNDLGTAEGADSSFTTQSHAAGNCPNEAIRQAQRSTFLPECRAYEQVSPVDKNGANVSQAEHNPDSPEPLSAASAVAPSGNQVTYVLSSPLADAESYTLYNLANALRGADGWSSRSASSPQAPWEERPMFATSVAISPTTTLEYSELALSADAVEGEGNYYLRDSATGSYELIAAVEDPDAAIFEQQPSLAVGPDFAVFGQTHALTPDATELGALDRNLYSYYQGQLHLLNEPGSVTHPENLNDIRARPVSEDGSRVYFLQIGGSGAGLYLSEDGDRGVPISVSHRPGDPQTPQNALFFGASEDGSVAYFTSTARLTADVGPGLGDVLYRYTADDGELTAITPTSESGKAGVRSFGSGSISTPVSADGSTVYFRAPGALVPGAVAGGNNIYAWHDGQTRLIGSPEGGVPSSPDPGSQWSVSPDGTKLAFLAQSSLTAYDTMGGKACALILFGETSAPCIQTYLYDWSTDELSCASCPEVGVAPQGHAALGGMTRLSVSPGQTTFTDSVTDSGAVFFDTPQKLVAADTNGKRDVYEFKDGEAKLISSGKSDAESVFHGLSADGRDVFFGTTERLVGQDDDNQVDLYDARVDGGFASQQTGPGGPAPCSGAGCQGPPAPPPGARSMGSSSFQGAGNASPRRSKAKKRCVAKKKRTSAKKRSHSKSKQSQQRAKACKGGNR